jgi:hypothetical protein
MTAMTNFPNPMRLIALVATLACLAGCGQMPNAPILDDSTARIETNGATPQARTLTIDDPTLPGAPAVQPEPTPDPELPPQGGGSTQQQGTQLTESLGGTVRSGRWRVEVPPGAFTGTARVSVTPNSRGGVCALEIYPAEKNYFATPVRLVVDCHNVPPRQLAKWFISWYNPGTGTWVRVAGSVVDTKKKTVSASPTSRLHGRARGGQAGW